LFQQCNCEVMLGVQPGHAQKHYGQRRKVFANAYLHRLQHRHFLFFNLAPLIATAVALALLPIAPPSPAALICFVALWAFTEFCIVAGFHRLFAHRSYKAHPALRVLLQIGGLLGGQGGLISWVAFHRRHHECSDKDGDPHSPRPYTDGKAFPRLRGLLHSQFTWMYQHDYPNVMHYAADLVRDRTAVRLDQFYFPIVVAGILLPGFIVLAFESTLLAFVHGVLWGGLVRIFALSASIGAVNSLLHTFGSRRFETADNSRNSAWFALFTFGDAWHNNHHAFPRSACAALDWYRVDPAYWIIKLLSWIGLTWDVYVPSKALIDNKRKNVELYNVD